MTLVDVIGAEERQYINIGANPVEKEICKKHNLETYRLTEDRYAVVTDKDGNIIINWLRKGEEIGKFGKKEVICSCGNSVKFLDEEKVKIVEKIVEVPVKAEKELESDVIVIVVEDDYEEPVPAYYPYRSYPYSSSYYSGYSYPVVTYSYGYSWSPGYYYGNSYYRDYHRDRRDNRGYHRPEPRQRAEPRSQPRPRSVHPNRPHRSPMHR